MRAMKPLKFLKKQLLAKKATTCDPQLNLRYLGLLSGFLSRGKKPYRQTQETFPEHAYHGQRQPQCPPFLSRQ